MKTTFDIFMAVLGILILAFLGYIFTHQYYYGNGYGYYQTRYYTVPQNQPVPVVPNVYVRY